MTDGESEFTRLEGIEAAVEEEEWCREEEEEEKSEDLLGIVTKVKKLVGSRTQECKEAYPGWPKL